MIPKHHCVGALLLSLVIVACGDGTVPTAGFVGTDEPDEFADAGPIVEAGLETTAPDAAGIEPAKDATVDAEVPELPQVWAAPPGEPLPCENRRLPFDFDASDRAFSKVNGFWMMWLAMRAFVSEEDATRDELVTLGFEDYVHIDGGAGLQAFVAASDSTVFVGFRGSTQVDDYLNNAKFGLMDGAALAVGGRLHAGFGGAVIESWDALHAAVASVASGNETIWLAGHSLGGTMATMTGVKLADLGYDVAAVYSFAGPRAGDSAFATYALDRLQGRSYRVVNHLDLTPHIPPAGIAAQQAAEVLDFDPLEGWAADLVKDLDYAHASGLFLFDEGTTLEYLGTTGDWEDREYWSDRAEHVTTLIGLVQDDRDHGYRHNHGTYLCKMLALRDGPFETP